MTSKVYDLLRDSKVDIGKVAASCSGIHQPSDVSPVFKAAKRRLATVTKKQFDVIDPVVERHIRTKFSTTSSLAIKELSAELKNKIVFGCLSIKYVLQDVLKPRLIVDGFAACGQYPLSYEKLMGQCYGKIPKEVLDQMHESVDDNVEYFLTHGELTEAQLDATNIPEFIADKGTPRDQRVLNHQRAVVLSHPDTINRYTEYVNKGLPIGDKIIEVPSGSERKQLTDAAKLIEKDNKKKAAAEKRKQEALRKSNLSKEEKALEMAEKRRKQDEKKAKESASLVSAKQLLGLTG